MISLKKDIKLGKSSDQSVIKYIQVQREYSSMNVTKYLNPKDVIRLGSQMSEWMIEKWMLHLGSVCFGKEDLVCLPNWHGSHSNTCNY